MARSFAHLWVDEEFADVDVLLTVDQQEQEGTAITQLAKLPAHRAILTQSPVLRAQVGILLLHRHDPMHLWLMLSEQALHG
jgi:hypothetical protein